MSKVTAKIEKVAGKAKSVVASAAHAMTKPEVIAVVALGAAAAYAGKVLLRDRNTIDALVSLNEEKLCEADTLCADCDGDESVDAEVEAVEE